MNRTHGTIFERMAIPLACVLLFAACLPILAACGEEAGSAQTLPSGSESQPAFLHGAEDMDLAANRESFRDVAAELEGGRFLGMQFLEGEPVQLWMAPSKKGDEGAGASVYTCYKDGRREVSIERIDESTARMIYVRDVEGYFYAVSGENGNKKVTKLDSAGKIQYTVPLGGNMRDICVMADGRLAVLFYEGNSPDSGYQLILISAKGDLTTVFKAEQFNRTPHLGTSEEGLLILSGDYVYQVDLVTGKCERGYSFGQTGYEVSSVYQFDDIQDFCVAQDGGFRILRSDQRGNGESETLTLVARGQERKDVVFRTAYHLDFETWLKECILEFNSVQEEYRIVLDLCEDGDDFDAFVTQTGVELATGKGPEILMGTVLIESADGLIEKGGLVDLAPLMQQAGIKREDYFPVAFDKLRTGDSIYSIYYSININECLMRKEVLGDVRNPGMEELLDAMLAYPEQAVYKKGYYAGEVLTELLQGSETLWGTIDWEKGTCDFKGELFAKLLQAARRYGYDERANYSEIVSLNFLSGISAGYFKFRTKEEWEAQGYVPVGAMFEDGVYPVSSLSQEDYRPLMLNANAANKEGAWEFLKFLLSEEAQQKITERDLPVKISVFEEAMEQEIENGPSESYDMSKAVVGSLTRERAEELEAFIESARALPYRTEPVIDIILEEARDYFNGTKDIPQVVQIIENRVNLYLQEQVR